jgi:phosphoserine phosphatase
VGFHSVVLDCDSTLVTIEGIDVLAGARASEVSALTNAAMAGAVPLEEVYERRLALIHPSRGAMESLGSAYINALVPDARETLAALLWLGKEVRIVSGGLRPPVEVLAWSLGLPPSHVASVQVHFDADGAYQGYDRASPLARSGGKAEIIRAWRMPGPVLLVGDGATDLEARPAVDAFAAYMGVVIRSDVADAADFVLVDASLAPVLALAADPADRARLAASPWGELLTRGTRMLAL